MTTTRAPFTPDSLRALALVGRVVTDGTRVGVARHADGPNWLVVGEPTGRPAHLVTDPERARLVVLEEFWSAHSEAEISVRWHGQNWLTTVPLSKIRRGVTLTKS